MTTPVGTVRELWRYPVKSMRGERLDAAVIEPRGLAGDRRLAVYDAEGKIGSGKITRRFRPIAGLRTQSARGAPGDVVIDASDGTSIACHDAPIEALSQVLGQPVTLRSEGETLHHDAAPIHLMSTASLGWISERTGMSLDAFAFRPNIVIDTRLHFPAEEEWIGRTLAIGLTVRLRVIERTERCIMVNTRGDGSADERVLRAIARDNDSCLGVYAQVLASGIIRSGDAISLFDAPTTDSA